MTSTQRAHEVLEVEVAIGEVLRRDDGVDAVLVRASGDGRVAEFGVQGVVAEQKRHFTRETLRLVNRPCVRVQEMVGHVVERQPNLTPVGETDVDPVLVGPCDRADVAVEDAEVVAVAEAEHAVTDAVAAVVGNRDRAGRVVRMLQGARVPGC
ncbi:MAG: hypothetical protein FD127_4437 [Acidimicrobiaceae bacterium]|nr:MAG: hypothetical protein FD127_4437 [Acidimicrobiaceae bacterium]